MEMKPGSGKRAASGCRRHNVTISRFGTVPNRNALRYKWGVPYSFANGTMLQLGNLEMTQEYTQGVLVGSFVLPASEVADVSALTQLSGPVLTGMQNSLVQSKREEDSTILGNLPGKGDLYLMLNPRTVDGVLREEEQDFLVKTDSLVYAAMMIVAGTQVSLAYVLPVDQQAPIGGFSAFPHAFRGKAQSRRGTRPIRAEV